MNTYDNTRSVRQRVQAAVSEFRCRASLEESTLTLDGAGVNAGTQYVVLNALGLRDLRALACVNVISGSIYPYLCLLAREQGQIKWNIDGDMSGWDRANRRWHKTSLRKAVTHFALRPWRKTPLFANECLKDILRQTTTLAFAALPVRSLPANMRVWLYDPEAETYVAIDPRGEYADERLEDLVACAAAVPGLYGNGTLKGRQFHDPVYSPSYRKLFKELVAGAKNHLISNMLFDKKNDNAIYLKPHRHGDGRRMILSDFARFVLNMDNPRIVESHRTAFGNGP